MPNSGKIATILGNVLTDSQIDLSTKADLVDGKIPSSQLPSYVDDILEYANLAAFPATGSTGIIYVAQDTNKIYRWTGSAYAEVSPTVGTTWGTITGTLSNQTDLQTALDAKVPTSRTLTINGTALDLSANRSFTVGDVRTDSTYANPAWITSLAWSKITSTPTTISGYGITNAYTDAQIQNFFNGANAISGYNKTNWDTAYGWGNPSGVYLPLAGGTMSGDITISGQRIKELTSTNKGIYIGNWAGAGYWGLGSTSNAHELKLDQVSSSTGLWEGATDVNLYLGSNRLVLHSGNYSTYSLPLTGGTLTGSLIGTSATFTDRIWSGTTSRLSTSNSTFKATTASDWAMQIQSPWSTAAQNYGLYIEYSAASPNNSGNPFIQCSDSTTSRFIVYSSGSLAANAATFSSSVTANQLLLNASSPKITFTPSGYSGSYRSYLGTDSSAQGVLQLGNNGANYIVAGNTAAGGALLFYVNATSEFIAGANGTLALTLNSGGSASFEKTITVVGNATFKHGNTEYTMFTSTNEINHYNADGTYAKVYINWPGGDVDIARSSILANSASFPRLPYGAKLYNASAGNSPWIYFGDETASASAKGIYLESYWMVLQGHYNEGYRFRYVNGVGSTTEAMTLKYNNTTINTKITYTDNTYMTGSPSYGFRFNSANDAYNNVIMYDGGNTYYRTSITINYNTSGQPGNVIPTKMWVHDGVSAFSNASTGDAAISTATSSSLLLGPRAARTANAGYYLAGISFDHLLSYSGVGTNFYSSVPHAWVGLRIVSYPGWETSALVFATRSDTAGTAGTTLERMCVMPDGKVGIGTKTPQSYLHVIGGSGTAEFAIKLAKGSYNDSGGHTTLIGFGCENANWSRSAIGHTRTSSYDRGYFGIYVSANNSDATEMTTSDIRVKVEHTGTVTASGDIVAYGSPSDITLKTIKSKVDNVIEKVSKLNGYYFDWNNIDPLTNIKEDIGVIAQEVEKVFPELARTNSDGKMSVRYQGLTAVLIEAVKELAAENNKLKEILERNNIQ